MHYPEPTSPQMNKQNCQNGITIVLKMFSPKNVNFQIPEDIKLHHVTSTYGFVFRGDDTTGFRESRYSQFLNSGEMDMGMTFAEWHGQETQLIPKQIQQFIHPCYG